MRSVLAIVAAVLLCSFPLIVFAETKEIVSEGTYNMGDGETPSVAESRALLKAKQVAIEQAGTYVESYSKVKNITLTQDEIQVLASGLMEVEMVEKKRTVVGDGINFWVKIKAKVNPDKMDEMAKKVKEKAVMEDYKSIQVAYATSQREIEMLKKQLLEVIEESQKKLIGIKIANDEKLFQSNVWFEKGQRYEKYMEGEDYVIKAIEAYTNAITLNPKLTKAYYNRGLLLWGQGESYKAIADFTSTIAQNPSDAEAYYWRSAAKKTALDDQSSGESISIDYDDAIDDAMRDLNKAIELRPDFSYAYAARGEIYNSKGQYKKALENYSIAVKLNPSHNHYYYRGNVYAEIKQYKKAIDDYSACIKAGAQRPLRRCYFERGNAYANIGKYDKAVEDYNIVITKAPDEAVYYVKRGAAYERLGYNRRSISDYEKACDLGSEEGCEMLQVATKKR